MSNFFTNFFTDIIKNIKKLLIDEDIKPHTYNFDQDATTSTNHNNKKHNHVIPLTTTSETVTIDTRYSDEYPSAINKEDVSTKKEKTSATKRKTSANTTPRENDVLNKKQNLENKKISNKNTKETKPQIDSASTSKHKKSVMHSKHTEKSDPIKRKKLQTIFQEEDKENHKIQRKRNTVSKKQKVEITSASLKDKDIKSR